MSLLIYISLLLIRIRLTSSLPCLVYFISFVRLMPGNWVCVFQIAVDCSYARCDESYYLCSHHIQRLLFFENACICLLETIYVYKQATDGLYLFSECNQLNQCTFNSHACSPQLYLCLILVIFFQALSDTIQENTFR